MLDEEMQAPLASELPGIGCNTMANGSVIAAMATAP